MTELRQGTAPGKDGVAIAYEEMGEGPTIIFMHGVGGNKTNWREQLAALSPEFRCVAWDARGYLDSEDPEKPLSFADFADDLSLLLKHLEVEDAHIVGLSMGGMIAQDFAVRYPGRAKTLTLAATSAGAMTAEEAEEFLALRFRPLAEGKTMAEIANGVVPVLAGSLATPEMRERLRQSTAAVRPGTYRQALTEISKVDFRSVLPAISAPTMVIVGREDKVLDVSKSDDLVQAIPGSFLTVIENAGHLCNIEAPDQFNDALRSFLGQHP